VPALADATAAPRRWGRGHVLLVAALGLVLAAGIAVAVVLLTDSGGDGGGTAAFPTTPTAASVAGLRTFATAIGHPVYWAGPLQSYRYEVRLTAQGRVFIRYLPKGVDVGDRRAAFLTVATYPVANAVRALRRAAAHGGVGIKTAGGGFAYYDRSRPTSVYFAAPSAPSYEVEVFDPASSRARALVLTGRVRPIG